MSDSIPADALPSRQARWGVVAMRLFAAIGVLAALWAGARVAGFLLSPQPAPAQVQAKDPEHAFAVVEVTALHGTNLDEIVIATAESMPRGDVSSYGGGARPDARNVILLNSTSGVSRKLLPDNSRRIVARDYLPGTRTNARDDNAEAVADSKAPAPPLAYYLFRVRAAGSDKEDVLVGDLATGRQAFLLTGLDGVDKVWMQSPTRVALLMRQGRKLHYRAIEIPQLKVVAARPVEID